MRSMTEGECGNNDAEEVKPKRILHPQAPTTASGPPPSRREVYKCLLLLQRYDGDHCKGEGMSLNYNKKNIPLAKGMRKNATPQENRLWYGYLSKYEVRFQRQKAIDNFIADFYCHAAKLVIEIDGSQHSTDEGKQKDELRTQVLEGYDLKVIRFTNRQIDTIFWRVCEYIDTVVKKILSGKADET